MLQACPRPEWKACHSAMSQKADPATQGLRSGGLTAISFAATSHMRRLASNPSMMGWASLNRSVMALKSGIPTMLKKPSCSSQHKNRGLTQNCNQSNVEGLCIALQLLQVQEGGLQSKHKVRRSGPSSFCCTLQHLELSCTLQHLGHSSRFFHMTLGGQSIHAICCIA